MEIDMQDLQIISQLLCSECRESVRNLLKLWDKQRIANTERLQQMATERTEEEIEREIDKEIEKQIERSDD